MTKQTKTLLGLAVVAGVGYYAYTQFSKPKSMVGFNQKDVCKCHTEELNGVYLCGDGESLSTKSKGKCGGGKKKAEMQFVG
jgi:hypothetical protein